MLPSNEGTHSYLLLRLNGPVPDESPISLEIPRSLSDWFRVECSCAAVVGVGCLAASCHPASGTHLITDPRSGFVQWNVPQRAEDCGSRIEGRRPHSLRVGDDHGQSSATWSPDSNTNPGSSESGPRSSRTRHASDSQWICRPCLHRSWFAGIGLIAPANSGPTAKLPSNAFGRNWSRMKRSGSCLSVKPPSLRI